MTQPAPDLIEKVVGFRSWFAGRDGKLGSTSGRGPWAAGVNEAQCNRRGRPWGDYGPHIAPGPNCGCGLYALHSLEHVAVEPTRFIGAVTAWGEIQVHAGGFRAQYAEVVALVPGSEVPASVAELTTALYGVPLVLNGDLEQVALTLGGSVPPELRPEGDPSAADLKALQGGAVNVILTINMDRAMRTLQDTAVAFHKASVKMAHVTGSPPGISRAEFVAQMARELEPKGAAEPQRRPPRGPRRRGGAPRGR